MASGRCDDLRHTFGRFFSGRVARALTTVIDNVGATQFPAQHTSRRRPAPSPMCGAPRARSKNAVSLIKHRRRSTSAATMHGLLRLELSRSKPAAYHAFGWSRLGRGH